MKGTRSYTKEDIKVFGADLDEEAAKDPSAKQTISDIVNHKNKVNKRLTFLADQLLGRAKKHDNSKLEKPELGWLVAMDKEPKYPYGSDEYFEKMKRWRQFFDHHYQVNSHHPNHFVNGVAGMTLTDLCEYLVDIIAYEDNLSVDEALAVIEDQKQRFGLDEQLTQILKNTLLAYFTWLDGQKPLA